MSEGTQVVTVIVPSNGVVRKLLCFIMGVGKDSKNLEEKLEYLCHYFKLCESLVHVERQT